MSTAFPIFLPNDNGGFPMTIEDWLAMASVIEGRRSSAAKYAARTRHLRAFPHEQIDARA